MRTRPGSVICLLSGRLRSCSDRPETFQPRPKQAAQRSLDGRGAAGNGEAGALRRRRVQPPGSAGPRASGSRSGGSRGGSGAAAGGSQGREICGTNGARCGGGQHPGLLRDWILLFKVPYPELRRRPRSPSTSSFSGSFWEEPSRRLSPSDAPRRLPAADSF